MNARVSKLTALLGAWYECPRAELPERLGTLVDREYPPSNWDSLTPNERRRVARKLDGQHPTNLVDAQIAKQAFSRGFYAAALSRRNKEKAARPRASRQLVKDADILRIKAVIEKAGLEKHRQISEARRRLIAEGVKPIALRSFRARWTRLVTARKKGG